MLRILRTLVSFIPSKSLLSARRLKDLPLRVLGKPHEADFELLRKLKNSQLNVVDIGANRGQSIDSFRAVLKQPNIISIEPNMILADSLKKYYSSVKVLAIGLGDIEGKLTLHIPRYGHTYWDTRASLNMKNAQSFLSPHNFAWFTSGRASIEKSDVNICKLDELQLAPDILKLDAEGLEGAILNGGQKTLKHLPLIICETVDSSVMNVLEPLGYKPFHVVEGDIQKGAKGLNTFFLCKKHLDLLQE